MGCVLTILFLDITLILQKHYYNIILNSINYMKTNYNSLLLDWLSSLVGYTYSHSFKDNWMMYNIWDGSLSITLVFNVPEQRSCLTCSF